MDHDQRTMRAQQQDPELCARIVRNIADLERDYLFAWGPLSERLMREAAAVFQKAAPEPWEIVGKQDGVSLRSPDWKAIRGVGHDAWLELAEIVEDDEEHSWAAVVVSAGPTKFCLELKFRPGLTPFAAAVPDKVMALAHLLKLGFQREPTSKRLFVPIAIEAEVLARGFELNDLDEALTPLRRAVELAVSGKADIDALIGLVRDKAKQK